MFMKSVGQEYRFVDSGKSRIPGVSWQSGAGIRSSFTHRSAAWAEAAWRYSSAAVPTVLSPLAQTGHSSAATQNLR